MLLNMSSLVRTKSSPNTLSNFFSPFFNSSFNHSFKDLFLLLRLFRLLMTLMGRLRSWNIRSKRTLFLLFFEGYEEHRFWIIHLIRWFLHQCSRFRFWIFINKGFKCTLVKLFLYLFLHNILFLYIIDLFVVIYF